MKCKTTLKNWNVNGEADHFIAVFQRNKSLKAACSMLYYIWGAIMLSTLYSEQPGADNRQMPLEISQNLPKSHEKKDQDQDQDQ